MPTVKETSATRRAADHNKAKEKNSDTKAVTFHIPSALDKNVTAYCAIEGVSKTEFVTQVLADAIKGLGLQPDKEPKIAY